MTPPSGSVLLAGDSGPVRVVREARAAAVAARVTVDGLPSTEIRARLCPHVDALDASTLAMA